MLTKATLYRNLMLLPGWRTRRKIVVIESDDWGCMRMPDLKTLNGLARINQGLIEDPMNSLDSLETNEDLLALYDVLTGFKDSNGDPAIITANTIVANPDYDKIRDDNFSKYSYEPFPETLKKYPGRDQVMNLINHGMTAGIYKPQFHGREHINVGQWLYELQSGNHELLEAFRYRVFGINLTAKVSMRNNLMAAFDYNHKEETEDQKLIIHEGISLFKEIFRFQPESFIATSYIWDSAIERCLKSSGIKYIQGIPYQYIPNPGGKWYNRKFHFTGQRNNEGQVYLARNASFEPSLSAGTDVVGECLQRIEMAFKWRKPAIIGSHRVNFIGSLDVKNRTNSLEQLTDLLLKIIKKWPETEFMSSDQLGRLIKNTIN
jgi:hypothetical protein